MEGGMPGLPVTIVKAGELINIEQEQLGKGDLVVLQAGDVVPADLKLVEARGLEVDEFDITGELLPVAKQVADEEVILYRGSRVLRGAARGLVLVTGRQTEYGQILGQERERSTPLSVPLFKASSLRLLVVLLPALILHLTRFEPAAAVAFYVGWAVVLVWLQNEALFRQLLVTTAVKRLAHGGIQVRDDQALVRLAEIDLICFDKTGILTTRDMEVRALYFADRSLDAGDWPDDGTGGSLFPLVKMACALCHDVLFYVKKDQANPVDRALIALAVNHGADLAAMLAQYRRIYEVPFDSEARWMACGFERDGQEFYFLKGDPDAVLEQCRFYMTTGGALQKLDWEFRRLNQANLAAIHQQGDVAIAVAYTTHATQGVPDGYIFLCLIRLANPLQPQARETIRRLTQAGLRSLLLTGDRAITALQVAAACGIVTESRLCLIGPVMERLEATEIARQAAYCSVFARLLPSQKGFLIRLLQRQGHHVAMVGDGPNDSLALKAAEVGISLSEHSSPLARQSAKILIGNLVDLVQLVESAHRLERRARHLQWLRVGALVVVLLGPYLWLWATR